jgi:hypothetical protein
MSYLPPTDEARYLCDFIQFKMTELAALKASMAPTAGPSWLATPPPPPPPPPTAQGEQGLETEVVSIVEEPTAFLALLEDDKGWSADKSWEAMEREAVDGSEVRAHLGQMGCFRDVSSHQHHAARDQSFGDFHHRHCRIVGIRGSSHDGRGSSSPFLRVGGLRVPVRVSKVWENPERDPVELREGSDAKEAFSAGAYRVLHVARAPRHLEISFSLGPLLPAADKRGIMFLDLNGSHVKRLPAFFRVEIATSKNHPEGFSFWIPIDDARPNCVGVFFAEFITVMGIQLGHKDSFFACKIAKLGDVLRTRPTNKLATSSMCGCCKDLIVAAGLDPSAYATHSSKRGGTLEAMKAGLSDRFRSWAGGRALLWLLGTPRVTRRCGKPLRTASGFRTTGLLGA